MHRLRDEALLTRPLEQEACDGLVEDLVRRRAGLGDEVVGAAEGHRPADRIGSIGVSPGVRRDEERTLGQRMEEARLVDDGVGARAGRRPADEYQGHVRVLLGEPIEQLYAVPCARDALDPVAPGVALDELSLDPIEDIRVLVDCDDDGERHAATLLDLAWPSLSGAHRAHATNRATQCRMPLSGEAAATPSGYRRRVDRRDEHVAWLVGSIGFAGIAVMLAIDVLLFQIV